MRTQTWAEHEARWKRRHGDKLDLSSLHEKFRKYFLSDQRIKVVAHYPESGESYVRFGRVGTTTGWKPGFLLMHRSSDIGSSDLLSESDQVVAVKEGRRYRTIKFCKGETGTKDPRCGREWGHDGPCDWRE